MASSGRDTPVFVHLAAHPLRWRLLTELAEGDRRVRELMTLVDASQNLVSYHLRLLREGGLVTAARSSFDGRDSYYRLDLDRCAQALDGAGAALHPGLDRAAAPPARPGGRDRRPRPAVLFVCTGNSARSPIAEALLRHHTDGRVTVTSAGTDPKPAMHPDAVRVLLERYGIDISDQRPRHLDTMRDHRFDYVVTLCDKAREVCPEPGGRVRRVHWSTPDPATADHDEPSGRDRTSGTGAFARTAANIDARIRYLLPVLDRTTEVRP